MAISKYEGIQNSLEKARQNESVLSNEATGYSYQGDSYTPQDLDTDRKLLATKNKIEALKTKALKEDWYGNTGTSAGEATTSSGENQGLIGRLVDTAQTGLYGVMGGLKWATGMNKSKQLGLYDSIKDNITNSKQTFGDVLREKTGMSGAPAFVLGLAGDIALDPLNWITVGTALVPKMAKGIISGTMESGLAGGAKAAAYGASTRTGQLLLQAEDLVSRVVPGVKKYTKEYVDALANDVLEQERLYQKLVGTKALGEVPVGSIAEISAAKQAGKAVKTAAVPAFGEGTALASVPMVGGFLKPGKVMDGIEMFIRNKIPMGNNIIKAFKYSPLEYAEAQKILNSIPELRADLDRMAETGKSITEVLEDYHDQIAPLVSDGGVIRPDLEMPWAKGLHEKERNWQLALGDALKNPNSLEYKRMKGIISDADYEALNGGRRFKGERIHLEEMAKVADETFTGLEKTLQRMKAIDEGKTGVKAYDDAVEFVSNKIKDFKWRPEQIRSDNYEDIVKSIDEDIKTGKISAEKANEINSWRMTRQKFRDLEEKKVKGKLTNQEYDELREFKNNYSSSPIKKIADYEKEYATGKMTTGEKVLRFFDSIDQWFKMSKVATSPAAIVNSVLGNPTMLMAAGVDLSPNLLNSLYSAYRISAGKAAPELVYKMMLSNPEMLALFLKKDGYFTATTGVDIADVGMDFIKNSAIWQAKKDGVLSISQEKELRETLKNLMQEFEETSGTLSKAREARITGEAGTAGEKVEMLAEAERQGRIKDIKQIFDSVAEKAEMEGKRRLSQMAAEPTSYAAQEIERGDNYLQDFRSFLKVKAKEGGMNNLAYKVLDKGVNGMAKVFESSDKIYKLGTTMHLVNNGLSAKEMEKVIRLMPMRNLQDYVTSTYFKNGQQYFRIAPEKALDFANEVYMNYSAMPGAVRIMRSIPIIGSPFISFSYAMLPKFAKTLVHNPSFFSKLGLAGHEMGAGRGPTELAGLEYSPYYQWYNDPGMIRLPDMPFFRDNPMYLNIANIVPFYSMSITGESQRGYKGTGVGKLAEALDKLQLFQTPVGQVIKDYILLPSLIADGEIPKGQFGQQLYPQSATAGEKALYATRSLLDAYTPNVLGPIAGVASGFGVLPTEVGGKDIAQWYPGYNVRTGAFAAAGKSPEGIKKTEPGDAFGTYGRSLLGSAGVKLYTMPLKNLRDSVKKAKSEKKKKIISE